MTGRRYSVIYDWSDERCAVLRELWEQGFSGGFIARRLSGPVEPLSRSAVIAKARRKRYVHGSRTQPAKLDGLTDKYRVM